MKLEPMFRIAGRALACAAALAAMTTEAQELLRSTDGTAGVNALPVSENRWQTREISVPGGLKESHYKSLPNLDFFALEYGEGFPETAFDTTGTNVFRKVFGYSKKEGGAGIRFGRGWGKYVMSRYGFDVDIDQSGDTEWQLTYNKASDWVETKRFKIKGTGRVKLSQTIDMIAPIVRNTEVSGLELSCLTKGVKGTIRTFRLVPRIAPILWRRTFTLPADPARAGFTMRNYPVFTLRVNGHVVGEGDTNYGNGLRKYDLTKNLTAGLNEVTIDAESAGGYGPSFSFYGELFTVSDDGTTTRFDSDDKWEYSFDGEAWLKPQVRGRIGLSRNEGGDYAQSSMPLHAGALDVTPDDPNGYPVFDFDRPIRWTVKYPRGVKDAVVTAVARQTVDAQGRLVDKKLKCEVEVEERNLKTCAASPLTGAPGGRPLPAGQHNKERDVHSSTSTSNFNSTSTLNFNFSHLPVGAYEIEWTLKSGDRVVDALRNEMVVCGPIGQTEVSCADFEKTLKPRLKTVQTVDCTQAADETRFLDHSGPYGQARVNVGRVVDLGNGIRARETGPDELSFFSYKLDVGRLGALHILEVDVPDVREQTLYCWINESIRVGFCNNGGELGSTSWANATGSLKCGGIMPLSGKVKTVRIVFCPCSRLITASFEKGKSGGPAAVCGFRVYEVEGDLPALKVPKTERRYGNHNERQIFAAWGAYVDPAIRYEMCGPSPRCWSAAFAAARNRTAYLRYCGHNASIEGGYMYTGWFPTRSGESTEPEAEFDFRYPMFKMYRHNGIHTYVGYEYLRSPVLGRKGLLDTSDREVQAGTSRTVYEVSKDGRQHIGYMGNGINFLNPDVRLSMTNVLREVYERYAPIGDIEGLYVVNCGWWLPGIVVGGNNGFKDVSFDDDTIELFERETGVRLGCGWSGKARFRKRYEKLNGEYAKVWYGWRAKKMRDALEEMRSVVTSGPWKWKVYATGSYRREKLNPFSRLGGTVEERAAYEAKVRMEAGFPVELYGEGSGSEIGLIPSGTFGREVYLEDYGSLFNPGSAAIRWKNDACFYACGSLNEHWVNSRGAKKWWWRNNGVDVYDVKQIGENAFFDLVETMAAYTPKLMFHTWLDVNVTSAQAEECRRFVEGFYATPLDRRPADVPSVTGVLAKRYGDAVQLVNATPWGVKGKVRSAQGEGGAWEMLEIPPYGVVVRMVGKGSLEGAFAMAGGCPHKDFAAARAAMSYETMRAAHNRTLSAKGRPNQERFLAALAKDGVVRVDAGSWRETVDEAGVRWLPDQNFAGSDTYGNEFAGFVNRGPVPIGNTKTPSVYRTESGGGSEFIAYHFPVPKGTYRLVCHVAETYDEAPGRIMEVTVNGETRKVDVWQLCGGRMRAGQFVFENIKVPEGGTIRYESTSRPIVNAFEVYRTDRAPAK